MLCLTLRSLRLLLFILIFFQTCRIFCFYRDFVRLFREKSVVFPLVGFFLFKLCA